MHSYAIIYRVGSEWFCHTFTLTVPLSETDYHATICRILTECTRYSADSPVDITLLTAALSDDGNIIAFNTPLAHFHTMETDNLGHSS